MTPPSFGRLFYGSLWIIEDNDENLARLNEALSHDLDAPAEDVAEAVDALSEHYGAHLAYRDGTYTVYFGHVCTNVSTDEAKFDEMSIVRIMDLDKGTLREDVRKDVRAKLEGTPMALRSKLSRPGFHIAWGLS